MHADRGTVINVSLAPQVEPLIQRKLDSGLYHSASEVIREALRLLEERDTLQAAKLERLRHDIDEDFDALDRGEDRSLDVESIKRRGHKARGYQHDAGWPRRTLVARPRRPAQPAARIRLFPRRAEAAQALALPPC